MEKKDSHLSGPRRIGSPPEPSDDPPMLPGIREEEPRTSTRAHADELQSSPAELSIGAVSCGRFPGMLSSPPGNSPDWSSKEGRPSVLSSAASEGSLGEADDDLVQIQRCAFQEYLEGVKQRLCAEVVSELQDLSKHVTAGVYPQQVTDPFALRCSAQSSFNAFASHRDTAWSIDAYSMSRRTTLDVDVSHCAKQPLRDHFQDGSSSVQPERKLKSVLFLEDEAPEKSKSENGTDVRRSASMHRGSLEAFGVDKSRILRNSQESEIEMTKMYGEKVIDEDNWALLPCWCKFESEQHGEDQPGKTTLYQKLGGAALYETHIDYEMKDLEWSARSENRRVHKFSEEDPEYAFIQDEKCISRRIISPFNTTRLVWDLVGVFCIAYDTLSIPLQFLELEESWFTIGMRWFAMVFWLFDIFLNFFTGHIDHSSHRVEMRPSHIALHYLRTWFFLDVLVVLPDWIILFLSADNSGVTRLGKVIRVLRALRAIRLLRLAKLRRLGHVLESTFNNEYLTCYTALIKIMVSVALLTHILGCFWFGMSRFEEEEQGWIAKFDYDESDVTFQYLTSVHWALCLFQGTMEVFPVTRSERAFAVVVQFIGLIIVSYFISSITHFMTEIRVIHDTIVQRRSHLVRFLCDMKISPELSVEVKQFADKVSRTRNTTEDEVEILGLLPDQMKKDLDLEIKGPSLGVHPLLNNLVWNSKTLARRFVEHMCHIPMHYSETLFRRSEDASQMYVLMIGSMVYEKNPNSRTTGEHGLSHSAQFFHRATVEPTDWLCEMAMWTAWVHRGQLIARAHCEVFGILREKLVELTSTLGNEMAESVYYHARVFINWVNEQVHKNVDDLTHMPTPSRRRKHQNLFGTAARLSFGSLSSKNKNGVTRML